MQTYRDLISEGTDNDTAGYAAPQGLRNVLIIQGNHEAWLHLIRLRTCKRNTPETAYVVTKIWENLLNTVDGKEMFAMAGADCLHGVCREGLMSCKAPFITNNPTKLIQIEWPLLEVRNDIYN